MADIFLRTRIGNVMLDAEIAEGHTSDLRITDNPVESGAEVSDHAVLMPKTFTIEGVIVDYEPSVGRLLGLSAMVPRSGADFLNLLPMAVSFATSTDQAKEFASRALSSYTGAGAGLVAGASRALAPWLPDFAQVASDMTGSGSRVQRIYESLLQLQKSGATVDIQTGLRLYKNMLLPMVSGLEDQGGSLRISIAARELFVVELKMTSGVNVPSAGSKKSGRAGAQSAAKSSKGSTNPSKVGATKNTSAIESIRRAF